MGLLISDLELSKPRNSILIRGMRTFFAPFGFESVRVEKMLSGRAAFKIEALETSDAALRDAALQSATAIVQWKRPHHAIATFRGADDAVLGEVVFSDFRFECGKYSWNTWETNDPAFSERVGVQERAWAKLTSHLCGHIFPLGENPLDLACVFGSSSASVEVGDVAGMINMIGRWDVQDESVSRSLFSHILPQRMETLGRPHMRFLFYGVCDYPPARSAHYDDDGDAAYENCWEEPFHFSDDLVMPRFMKSVTVKKGEVGCERTVIRSELLPELTSIEIRAKSERPPYMA